MNLRCEHSDVDSEIHISHMCKIDSIFPLFGLASPQRPFTDSLVKPFTKRKLFSSFFIHIPPPSKESDAFRIIRSCFSQAASFGLVVKWFSARLRFLDKTVRRGTSCRKLHIEFFLVSQLEHSVGRGRGWSFRSVIKCKYLSKPLNI